MNLAPKNLCSRSVSEADRREIRAPDCDAASCSAADWPAVCSPGGAHLQVPVSTTGEACC